MKASTVLLIGASVLAAAACSSEDAADQVDEPAPVETQVQAEAKPEAQDPEQLVTEVERPLPDFELASLDGQTFNKSTLAGKPWIVNFWASWCGPCIEEIPAMNRAWEAVEPDGIGMLAINAGEGQEAIETFLAKVPVDFEVILGDGDTLPDWNVVALPTTVVVDANGQVVFEALGPREWDDPQLLDRVRALIAD